MVAVHCRSGASSGGGGNSSGGSRGALYGVVHGQALQGAELGVLARQILLLQQPLLRGRAGSHRAASCIT